MNRELDRDDFPGIDANEWMWLLVNSTAAEIDPRRSAAHSEVFERAYANLVTCLDHVPRSMSLETWWMSDTGQFFAELLWNTSKPEDKLDPGEAIIHIWGDYTAETYHTLFLRLKYAYTNGKIRRLRIPEAQLQRRKGSQARTRNWWFWKKDLDKFKESVVD